MNFNPAYLIPGYGTVKFGYDLGNEIGTNIGNQVAPLFASNSKDQNGQTLRSYDSFNGDWLGYLKYRASLGDEPSLDRLMNYMMTEQSNQTARDWTAMREDSQLQRFVRDAKAAGFNPVALLQNSASPISSGSSGSSFSGNPYLSSYNYKATNNIKWASLILNFVSNVFSSVLSSGSGIAKIAASALG